MGEEKYILAYDHGTSGMKSAIVSTKGKIIGFEVEEFELFHPEQGAAEQNPHDWWTALVKTTHKLLAKNLVPVEDIIAVTSSNQMDGTIPVDKDGKTLYNCITWMDTRGAEPTKKMMKGLINIQGYSLRSMATWIPKTGGAPGLSGKDIFSHILWLKKYHPEIYTNTWKFMDCKDYLVYRLTGEVCTSYDCGILTWLVNDKDPTNIHYDKTLLRRAKIDRKKMPDLFPSTHIVGKLLPTIAKDLGLSENCQVVLGAGDMSAAAVGSGQVEVGKLHVCIGSSSWTLTHNDRRKLDLDNMIASLPSSIPGRYISFGEQEAAGINLTWLRDKVLYHKDQLLVDEKVPDVYKIFDELVAEVAPGEKKVIFTPWMFGERAPVEDHTIRAGLYNLSLDCDRRHIVRAVFEGVAFNSRWLLGPIEKMLGKKLEPINLVGGGALSNIWCQIYADVMQREIQQVIQPKEGNSRGAAFIASVALGFIKWEEISELIEIKKKYHPRPEYAQLYDDLFAEYLNIYKNNKKMYQRLNKFTH